MSKAALLAASFVLAQPAAAGSAPAAKETPKAAEAAPASPKTPCFDEAASYGQAEKELAELSLSRFGGDKTLYNMALDSSMRSSELGRTELARCIRKAAVGLAACSREAKALSRAEWDYNDPSLKDTDGELTRKTHMAAKDLEACYQGAGLPVPKGFVDKNRDRFTRAD